MEDHDLLRSPAEPSERHSFVSSPTIPCHHRHTQAVHCTGNTLQSTLLQPRRLQSVCESESASNALEV